jgi:hypothetical protein
MPFPRRSLPRGLSRWRPKAPRAPRVPSLHEVVTNDDPEELRHRLFRVLSVNGTTPPTDVFWEKTWPSLLRRALHMNAMKSFMVLATWPSWNEPRPLPSRLLSALLKSQDKAEKSIVWNDQEQRSLAYRFKGTSQVLTASDWTRWACQGGWHGMDMTLFGQALMEDSGHQASFSAWAHRQRHYPALAQRMVAVEASGFDESWHRAGSRREVLKALFAAAPTHHKALAAAFSGALAEHPLNTRHVASWCASLLNAGASLDHPFWPAWFAKLSARPQQASFRSEEVSSWSRAVLLIHEQPPLHPATATRLGMV